MEGPEEVVDELLPLRLELLRARVQHRAVHALHEHVELAALAELPDVVGEVAEHGLDEEDEADPLVPRVPDLVALRVPAVKQRNRFEEDAGKKEIQDLSSTALQK